MILTYLYARLGAEVVSNSINFSGEAMQELTLLSVHTMAAFFSILPENICLSNQESIMTGDMLST